MEWVSGLVSLQTAILREKLVEEVDSRECEIRKRKENPPEENGNRVEPVSDMENEIDECPKVEADTDSKDCETEISVKVEADLSTNNGCSPASTLSTCSLSPRHTRDLSSHPTLATQLAEYLAEHSTHPISALDPMVVQYLAHRQLQSLLPTPAVSTADVQARASLTPLHSRRQPAYMQYRSLSVGVGGGAGLDLDRYGHCNFLSARHATIFFDELSGQYELINYSQHGTMVDEVLYSLDTMGVAARYPEYKVKNPVEVMARQVGGGSQVPGVQSE